MKKNYTKNRNDDKCLPGGDWHDLFDSLYGGIIVADRKGAVSVMNPAAEALTGWTAKKARGRNIKYVFPLFTSNARKPIRLPVSRAARDGETVNLGQVMLVAHRGLETQIELAISPLRAPSGKTTGVVLLFCDITQREITARQVLAQQRMETMGTVTRGIARDFGRITAVVSEYAASMADSLIPGTKAHEDASRIVGLSAKARELTERLRNLAMATDPPEKQTVGAIALTPVLEDTVKLLHGAIEERKIALSIGNMEDLPPVRATRQLLLDVLMALFVNSIEAMPHGGTITVHTSLRDVTRPNMKLNPNARPGRYVILRIADTGAGIPSKALKRIFEPFFTTKDSDVATGLGLTLVHSALQGWGGWATVRSKSGKGTAFSLYLPKSDDKPPRRESVKLGSETILVIDDRPGDISAISTILAGAGLNVLGAATAEEGVALFRKHSDVIAAVLIDVIMPGNDAAETLRAIRKLDAKTGIVMICGFSRDFVRGHVREGGWGFVQKPVDPEQLLSVTRRMIEQKAELKSRVSKPT